MFESSMSFVSIFHQYSYLTPIAIHFERNNGFRKWKNLLFIARYFYDYDEAKILREKDMSKDESENIV